MRTFFFLSNHYDDGAGCIGERWIFASSSQRVHVVSMCGLGGGGVCRMQIVATKREGEVTDDFLIHRPSQMELVEILRRSLDGIVHLFCTGPVAHARRPLPYSFATDDV